MITHIAGYRFVCLAELQDLQHQFRQFGQAHALKGTILLSEEGININIAGAMADVDALKSLLNADTRFSGMRFHEYTMDAMPYQRFKVKLKKEIITFRMPKLIPSNRRARDVSPEALKQWLDENRDITLLDTRNDYEIELGTFEGAVDLGLKHFTDLHDRLEQLDKTKPVVTFCTGGIRCEKAALYLETQGFEEVYQLDGGILGYFNKVGHAHYNGGCFVFDERVSVKPE